MDLSKVHHPVTDSNRTELDSHADTCVAGANTIPLWFTDETVSVAPFIGEYSPLKDVPIASVATAWDSPEDGRTLLLIINEALYFGDRMNHTLLCPNQLRYNGIQVHDTPKAFDPKSPHAIIIPGQAHLPLHLHGVISFLETRKATEEEVLNCDRVELTSPAPWNPFSELLQQREELAHQRNACAATQFEPLELVGDALLPRLVSAIHISPPKLDSLNVIGKDLSQGRSCRTEAVGQTSRKSTITKEELARRWHIGLETAARTLLATTQLGMRYVDGPLERRLKTNQAHLRFPTLNMRMYTDTLVAKCRSTRGYLYSQVFTNGHGFSRCYLMEKKGDAHQTLYRFIREHGIPRDLTSDRAPEELHGEWGRVIKQYHITQSTTEPASPWQNRAEGEIGELKKLIRRALRHSGAPLDFWCYAAEWAAQVRSVTAHSLPILKTRTPEEIVKGHTPDISELAHFAWFEWVWYRDEASFPEGNVRLGRWIGVATEVGQAMTYWLLTAKGTVIARSSVIALQEHEKRNPLVLTHQLEFMKQLKERHTASDSNPTHVFASDDDIQVTVDQESLDLLQEMTEGEAGYHSPEIDDFTPETYDEYLTAQVMLPVGGEMTKGQVVKRLRDHNGRPIGIRHSNPILDSREYEVQFADGSSQSFLANTIAENLYSQVDTEGRQFAIMTEITDHEFDPSALTAEEQELIASGKKHQTTKGWKLMVAWKDGTTSLVPL